MMNEYSHTLQAGFWRRVTAFLIDTIGLYGVFVIFITPIRTRFPEAMPTIAITFLVLLSLYILFRDATVLGSIGKRLLHIRTIVGENNGVAPCGFGHSFLRNIFLFIPGFAFLEFWVMLFRKDKKRIGDLLAQTRVVLVPPHAP